MARTSIPISKLDSGRWQVRYRDLDGKQRKRSFEKHAEALSFYTSTKSSLDSGTFIPAERARGGFIAYAEQWAEAQDWKYSTRETFPSHLKRMKPHLGGLRLDQVDTLTLQRLRAALMDKYAVSTSTITLSYATHVMRSAYENGLVARDVTVGVKPPKRRGADAGDRVGPDQVPTHAEVMKMISEAPSPFRAAIALGACGLRIGEVMGVTIDRIHLEQETLTIDRQLQNQDGSMVLTRPKREKVRTIALPDWARVAIDDHLRNEGPFFALRGSPEAEKLLFRGGRSSPMQRKTFYRAAWKPTLRAAGLADNRYKFHSLRHWCASSMLSHHRGSMPLVADYLGDTVETVLRTYTHWLRDQDSHADAILDEVLVGPRSLADSNSKSDDVDVLRLLVPPSRPTGGSLIA